MAVFSVFVSSVMTGFESVRSQAAVGVERVGMHPILAERLSADANAPRRALLDEVAKNDVYLLLLGERYGDVGESGKSPTEEEYEEAVKRGKPILVLIQDVQMDSEQRAFLERVRGSWEEGVLYDKFTDQSDVAVAVAGALARLEAEATENSDRAREQAEALARGEERSGTMSSGVAARVAFVPLREAVLLDPVALEDEGLTDDLMDLARSSGLIPHRIGIDAQVTGQGVHLAGTDSDDWTEPEVRINPNGAVVVTGSVCGGGTFGGSLVDPDRLEKLLGAAGEFAQGVWQRIDPRGEIGRLAVTAAIPDAEHKGFGTIGGSSMAMGQTPPTVVAPQPGEIVPRGQVSDPQLVQRILAAIRRVFLDAGAVHDG